MVQRPTQLVDGGGQLNPFSRLQSKYQSNANRLFGGFTPYNPPSSSYYRDLGERAYQRKLEEEERKKAQKEAEKDNELYAKYGINVEGDTSTIKADDYFMEEEPIPYDAERNQSIDNDRFAGRYSNENSEAEERIRKALSKKPKETEEEERGGLLGVLDRYLVPFSDAMTETVFKGNNEKMIQNDLRDGKIDNPVNKATLVDRGLETDILRGAGTIAGYAAPVSYGYRGANVLLNRTGALSKISNPYAQRAVTGATAGALTEAGMSATNEFFNSEAGNLQDYALRTGIGALGGAALDPAVYGLGQVARRGLSSLRNSMDQFMPNQETMQSWANTLRADANGNVPTNVLALPEPQLRLPAPTRAVEPSLENIRNVANVDRYNLRSPIPQMPDNLRTMLRDAEIERYRQHIPDEPSTSQIETETRPQSYWQQRYEEFARQVQENYNPNNLNQETLEDLWTQFARYDEPYTLEQVVDLAYPPGFEAPPRTPPLLEALRNDQNIVDALRRLRPEPQQPPSIAESLRRIQRDVGTQRPTPQPEETPLQFRRTIQVEPPSTERNTGNRLNPFESLSPDEQSLFATQPRGFEAIRANRSARDEIAASSEASLSRLQPARAIEQTGGNAESFRAKVDRNPKKQRTGGFFQNLRTQFVDDLAPLENLERRLTGSVSSAEDSLYKQARLFRGSPEKANQFVRDNVYPIINDVRKQGLKIEDLGDYALAVHARDVNAQGINSGFTNAEIEDVIQKLGTPEMEAARQRLLQVNNSILDMLSTGDAPVVDSGQVATLRERWPNYMSLFRSFDDDKVDYATGLSRALSVATSPIQKLEGSDRNVIDPIESMIKNIFKATNVVDRNNVASKLKGLANKDVEGNIIRKIEDGEDISRLNVITFLENGKKQRFEVPPDVYRAMKDLDRESTNTIIKILQKPASWLRAGATLTPEFSLRNPLRDVPHAFIVSNSGFNPITDFTYGLVQSIGKGRTVKIGNKEFKAPGELYNQWIKENGGYGNLVSMDRNLHRQTLKKALQESSTHYIDVLDPRTYTTLLRRLANPLSVLRSISDVSESATKVGEFRAALRQGVTPQEAAYRARDIMDFGRSGASIREANKVVAFMNANIQGKSKLWRAFRENPMGVIGKSVAAVTIPTIGAIVAQEKYANEQQKKVLDDAPQWMKDTFYLVPIPGTNQIARIPKPFDLAFAFSNTIERAADYIRKNDEEAFDDWIKQGFSTASIPTMLTGLAPIIEGMANYSFFRQGPIIPQREQGLEFPDQYDVNTTEAAKFLGNQINNLTGGQGAFRNFGSPRVIDNTIQGLTGGLGSYVTSAIDYFARDDEGPERPDKNIDQTPLFKAFLVNQSSSGQALDDFYTLKDRLTKARGSAKQNEQEFPQEDLYDFVNDMSQELSDINKVIRTVENDPNMSGEEKRSHLDRLIKQRNEFARQAMELLRGE
ncbi:LPD38 domain-containing protein [Bacillus litorisediminis]|uniref:LPD38 domain-containing protein n=1 Tax=Bacillus litorisediminis TaxID=2922713 RepID=UPI001FABDD73|nr:LPD38 domain-containing protein [Bacillus litorisediminis]